MRIWRSYTFAAAHRLTGVCEEHKCGRVHGHTFRVVVTVDGPVYPATGMVHDFSVLDTAWAPIAATLDHRYLNDVEGLSNPTSEHLAQWIWRRLVRMLPDLMLVEVNESDHSGVVCSRADVGGPTREGDER